MMSGETDAVVEKGTVLTVTKDTDILHLWTERTQEIKGREEAGNLIFTIRERAGTTPGKMITLRPKQIEDTRAIYFLCNYQTSIWFKRRTRAREPPLLWRQHSQKVKSEEV